MGIQLSIKTNQKQVSKNIKRYQSFLPRIFDKGLKQAGFHLLAIIKELTKEGKSTAVDLFYDGRMLGSLTPSSTVKKRGKGKVTLAFSNSQMMKRALFNQVLNEPTRKFFGFDNRTEKIINKGFERFVAKEFRRIRI